MRLLPAAFAACVAVAGVSTTATALGGGGDPSQVTDDDVEVAALAVLTYGLANAGQDVSAGPCPMMTQESLGFYLGQQAYIPNFAGFYVTPFYEDSVGEGYPGIDCGVDLAAAENPDPAAPHYPVLTAAYLPAEIAFQDYLNQLPGSTVLTPSDANGGEIGGQCAERAGGFCFLSWHRGALIVSIAVAGGTGDITRAKTEAMLTAMVPEVITNLIASMGSGDVSLTVPSVPGTVVTVPESTLPATTIPPTAPQVTVPPATTVPPTAPPVTTLPATTAPPTAPPVTTVPATQPVAPSSAPVAGAASPVAVTLTNQGDAAQSVDLTPVFTVGSSVLFESTSTMTGRIAWADGTVLDGSVTLADTQVAEIIAANPDGSYTQRLIVQAADSQVVSGPPEAERMLSADYFNSILGVPMLMSYDTQNVMVAQELAPDASVTPEQSESITGNLRNNQSAASAYPADRVGVGAAWTGVHPFAYGGGTGTFTVNYRLESLSGDQWTITYDYTIDLAQMTFDDGATATGTITESGRIVGSVSSPLTSTSESETTAAASFSDGFTDNTTVTRRVVATPQA